MAEIVVALLIGFLVAFCFGTLFFGKYFEPCRRALNKEELLAALTSLPENAKIYISIDRR